MCICSNSPKKLDELLTFSRSAFVKIIGTPARQWIYVFMISVGFFLDHGNLYLKHIPSAGCALSSPSRG